MKTLPYDRSERVGQAIFEVIAALCRERLNDPRLATVVITGVKVTRDLRLARIYYFLRGDATIRKAGAQGLAHAEGLFKRAVAERLAMKFTPELSFHFDDSIEHGERVDELLERIKS